MQQRRWRLMQIVPEYQLISDYPLVYENRPNTLAAVLENNVLMPVSNKYSLTNIESDTKLVDPKYRYYQEMILIHEAIRHVCCDNLNYLKTLVQEYKRVRETSNWEMMRLKLFEYFK